MHELSAQPCHLLFQKKYMQAPLVRPKTGYRTVTILGIFG